MFRSWASALYKVLVVATLVLVALTVRDVMRERPFNVVILTIDSLRSSDFTPQTAPTFYAAMQGALRPHAHRTVSAWTAPNIIAILSGMSPFDQGVHARGQYVLGDALTPLEQLAGDGWHVGNVQAFAKTEVFQNLGVTVDTRPTWMQWLAHRQRDGDKFVFWHHYLDVHLPYSPASALVQAKLPSLTPAQQARIDVVRTRSAIPMGSVTFEDQDQPLIHDLYISGVRQFDLWFADFWRYFTKTGLDQHTILVVTADHGEELLERGRIGHASTTHDASLHEEIVNIPMFILLPPSHPLRQKGFQFDADLQTDHLDIMPTVLSLIGVSPVQALPGRNLTVDQHPRPWFAYSSKGGYGEPYPDNISSFVAATITDSCKMIVRAVKTEITEEGLYDLRTDGWERINLLGPDGRQSPQERCETVMGGAAKVHLAQKVLTARQFVSPQERMIAGTGVPVLLWPKTAARLGYDDLAGRFSIEWSGDPSASYIVGYELGESPFSLSGEMRVVGTRKDFGDVDRHYWDTWVVPYKKARIKIRAEGTEEWSAWETVYFQQ
ncbi:sulfatase-like hydrolase/transferase [Magnetovibrio sp.]|uniref:sulfatase-like hydrolase/transferase n=1 Tax=Magnetovibrio sp. TaxID=2024836 RepID=UPI002F928D12